MTNQIYKNNPLWLRPGETPEQYKSRVAVVQAGTQTAKTTQATQPTTQATQTTTITPQQQDLVRQAMEQSLARGGITQQQAKLVQQSLTPIKDVTPITTEEKPPELPTQTNYDAYFGSLAQETAQTRASLESAYQKQIDTLKLQQEASQKKIDEFTSKSESTLEEVKTITQPWQSELEKTERERLKVEENFFANQQSVGELETLLNKAMEDIREAEGTTGLGAIRYPRIAQIKEDYQARVGVVEAVMAARNNQIGVANNLIDRSITAITNDKNSQLTYYNAVLGFYDKLRDQEGNKLINLEAQERSYINAQIGLLQNDLTQAEENTQYIKDLMLDPSTAQMVEAAGVKLTDTPQQIQAKFAQYSYSEELRNLSNTMSAQGLNRITAQQANTLPSAQVLTQTDSKGNVSYWQIPKEELGFKDYPADYKNWILAGSPGTFAEWIKDEGKGVGEASLFDNYLLNALTENDPQTAAQLALAYANDLKVKVSLKDLQARAEQLLAAAKEVPPPIEPEPITAKEIGQEFTPDLITEAMEKQAKFIQSPFKPVADFFSGLFGLE